MPKPDLPKPEKQDLPTKSPEAAGEAREMAQEYSSVFAPHTLKFDDGTTMQIPPYPQLRMLDDEQLEAYDDLMFESESYDREDDTEIPEQKVYDKNTKQVITTLPPTTRKGLLLGPPYRKGGVLIKPPWEVRIVKAALGEADYAVLRTKEIDGRSVGAKDVVAIWNEQQIQVARRQAADSKSAAGVVDSPAVPETDTP